MILSWLNPQMWNPWTQKANCIFEMTLEIYIRRLKFRKYLLLSRTMRLSKLFDYLSKRKANVQCLEIREKMHQKGE